MIRRWASEHLDPFNCGILVLVVLALVLGVAGCGARGPVADTSTEQNTGSADVIAPPVDFFRMATKCDNGNRLYFNTHGALAVVPGDPTCKEGS